MKKYLVKILFKNSQYLQFETDTNVRITSPVLINGGRFIVTENQYVVNVDQIKKMEVKDLK